MTFGAGLVHEVHNLAQLLTVVGGRLVKDVKLSLNHNNRRTCISFRESQYSILEFNVPLDTV